MTSCAQNPMRAATLHPAACIDPRSCDGECEPERFFAVKRPMGQFLTQQRRRSSSLHGFTIRLKGCQLEAALFGLMRLCDVSICISVRCANIDRAPSKDNKAKFVSLSVAPETLVSFAGKSARRPFVSLTRRNLGSDRNRSLASLLPRRLPDRRNSSGDCR
jgi:hypothetical protein